MPSGSCRQTTAPKRGGDRHRRWCRRRRTAAARCRARCAQAASIELRHVTVNGPSPPSPALAIEGGRRSGLIAPSAGSRPLNRSARWPIGPEAVNDGGATKLTGLMRRLNAPLRVHPSNSLGPENDAGIWPQCGTIWFWPAGRRFMNDVLKSALPAHDCE